MIGTKTALSIAWPDRPPAISIRVEWEYAMRSDDITAHLPDAPNGIHLSRADGRIWPGEILQQAAGKMMSLEPEMKQRHFAKTRARWLDRSRYPTGPAGKH